MDSHTIGRAKDAWRERNAGAEAPGDGQNVADVEPTVARVTASPEPAALVDPGELAGTSMTTNVENPSQTIEAEPAPLQTIPSSETASVARGRGRPRKT